MAALIAVGVNADGRREVLGIAVSTSETEPFWLDFLHALRRRGLAGVGLVVSDAHEGPKAAVAKVLPATWQRCRVGLLKKRVWADSLCAKGDSGRVACWAAGLAATQSC